MASIEDIGDRCDWLCWVCDAAVDPNHSVNDDLGPSLDRCEVFVKQVGKKKPPPAEERLAHRGCNTKKGAVKPVIAWPGHLMLFDPAPIIQSAERLINKGGKELVARCASKSDADEAAAWLIDRLARLVPEVKFTSQIDQGGGQFLLALLAPR
jgi:hypothetical protein